MNALVVYVGQKGIDNFSYGLEKGIWGFKPPKAPLGGFGPGDWIVFGRGFTGGSPRTTRDEWSRHSIQEVAIAEISKGLTTETTPEWPDERRNGRTLYPKRLRFGEPTRSQAPIKNTSLAPQIVEALRVSAITNSGVLIPADQKLLEALRSTILDRGGPSPEILSGGSHEESNGDVPIPKLLLEIENFIRARGFNFETKVLQVLYASLRAKPFVILAGNSGTGKSRLARLFSEAVGANTRNGHFRMIPVRPDWNDSSDLLGYFDLNGVFRPGQLIPTLLLAHEQPEKPFFICLDEMNLARVEHYFSDFLSVLESRRKENGRLVTDVVLREEQIARMEVDSLAPSAAAALVGLKSHPRPLGIPPNLFIVGTVNMDETTQPFSRKVLDRANTLEFNDIDLTEGVNEDRSEANVPPLDLRSDFLEGEFASLQDMLTENQETASEIANFLQQVNRSLAIAGFEVGYRVRDESIAFAIYAEKAGMSVDDVRERIVLQKVLPRMQGSSPRIEKTLISLLKEFARNEEVPESESTDFTERLAHLRNRSDASPVLRKLAGMLLIFREEGFTSFWLA